MKIKAMDGVGKEESDMEKEVRTWALNTLCAELLLFFRPWDFPHTVQYGIRSMGPVVLKLL